MHGKLREITYHKKSVLFFKFEKQHSGRCNIFKAA